MTKKFKLLQNLPTIEAGAILNYNSKKILSWSQIYNSTLIEYTGLIAELLQDIRDDEEWLQEIKEKPVLKYDNGALMEEPEEGTAVYCISYFDLFGQKIDKWVWQELKHEHTYTLKNFLFFKNIFLTEQEADFALKVLQTQNRLLKKIKEIDAENNWVADWENSNQDKYYLCWDYYNNKKDWEANNWVVRNSIYMSKQASDYMLSDAVSHNDFKLFLGIKD